MGARRGQQRRWDDCRSGRPSWHRASVNGGLRWRRTAACRALLVILQVTGSGGLTALAADPPTRDDRRSTAHEGALRRRRRARRVARAAFLGFGVVAAACSDRGPAAPSQSQSPTSQTTALPGASVARVDPTAGTVRSVIRVGGDPLLLVTASSHVWTLNLEDGSLSRIDPATDRATTVRVGVAVGIASDGTDLWVAHDGRRLSRLDGTTGDVETSFTLGAQPLFALRDAGFLAVAGGSIWITVPVLGRANAPQALWRVDAATGGILGKIPIGTDPRSPLAIRSYVWVVTSGDERVVRIDAASGEATEVPTGPLPVGVAWGADSLWVAHERPAPQIWRIDPETREPIAKIEISGVVRGLAFGEGLLWVATESGLVAIHPSTNTVAKNIALTDPQRDLGPIGVASLNDSIWVSVE